MRLDSKTLETVAIAIAIAAGCEPCTRYHVRQARKLGATDTELVHMIALAGSAGNASKLALDEVVSATSGEVAADKLVRHAALARVGLSVCRNGVRPLRGSIDVARQNGVTDQEIMEIIGLTARIKEKAASHLDRVIEHLNVERGTGQDAATLCT